MTGSSSSTAMPHRVRTQVVRASDPSALHRALDVLRGGGLVAFPTDTVYGLGALAFESAAALRLYQAKEREAEKAIPVLLSGVGDLDAVASASAMARRLAEKFWPGPLTLVVVKRPELPSVVAPADTVGVRVPDHPVALHLLRAAGPLAVTSANRSGSPSPRTADEVRAELGGRIELILDGGECPGGRSSTVVDCTRESPLILREGPITLGQIEAALD
jgi:L-threonylcarbamoyladenylate synthase